MKIIDTKFNGLKILNGIKFDDNRGYFREIYLQKIFKNKKFIFWCMSKSKKNVLRGMHIQFKNPQAKLITVTHGKIYDVAIDLRKNSKTYGKYVGLTMSDKDNFSFFIPKGFAHGFVCLSKKCTVYYKCSNYRNSQSETTIAWNDKTVNIKWPVKKPILSTKDKNGFAINFLKSKIK